MFFIFFVFFFSLFLFFHNTVLFLQICLYCRGFWARLNLILISDLRTKLFVNFLDHPRERIRGVRR